MILLKAAVVMENNIEHISLYYGGVELSFFCISIKHDSNESHILHRHSYYEVHFSGDSYLDYQFGDKTVSLAPNQIIIIPPNVLHYSVGGLKKSAPIVISFSISQPQGDNKLLTALTTALKVISLKAIGFSAIPAEELILLGKPELYNSFLGICKLKAVAADFSHKLFALALKGKDFTVSDDADALVLIDNLINIPDITIKDIAAATNYSERQISRLIKSHYGLTLSQIKRKSKG